MKRIQKNNYSVELDEQNGIMHIMSAGVSLSLDFIGMKTSRVIVRDDKIAIIDAYTKTDIIYNLMNSGIKEKILLKSRFSPQKIDIQITPKDCHITYNPYGRYYSAIGKNEIEFFRFSNPKIEGNRDLERRNAAKMIFDQQRSLLTYTFKKNIMRGSYPVLVDPTFIFFSQTDFPQTTISRTSRNDTMFVSTPNTIDSLIENSVEGYVPHLGRNQKYFSSDDVVFGRDLRIFFPFVDTSEVTKVKISILQGDSEIYETFNSSGSSQFQIGTYNVDGNSVDYIYVDMSLPSAFERKINVLGEVSLDSSKYGDFKLFYERSLNYIPSVDLQLSFNDSFITTSDGSGYLNANLIVSHDSSFKPFEYNVLPFEFDDDHIDDFANTETFLASPFKIENQSSQRTNLHFKVNPESIPKPIISETASAQKQGSVQLDIETLIGTMPGVNDYFKIGVTGNWEFWALFSDINYDGGSADVRPFVIVKNNSKFTDSVFIVGFEGASSIRKEWVPGDTDTANFWREFTDTDTGYTFEEKIRETYLTDGDNPFSLTGIGIETNFSFGNIIDDASPSEVLLARFLINVSGDDYFDVLYEFRNETSNDLRYVSLPHDVIYMYAKDLVFHTPGQDAFDRRTKFSWNYRNNNPDSESFDWVPENISSGTKFRTQTMAVLSGATEAIEPTGQFSSAPFGNPNETIIDDMIGDGITLSGSRDMDNFVPTDRKSKTLEEITLVTDTNAECYRSNSSITSFTDITSDCKDENTTFALFVNTSNYILIGGEEKFEKLIFDFSSPSNGDNLLTFEFFDGSVWNPFFPDRDDTNGFQQTGVVEWEMDDSTFDSWVSHQFTAIIDGNNNQMTGTLYWVRIRRSASLNTVSDPVVRTSVIKETLDVDSPKNSSKFINADDDPRWYTGPKNATIVHDTLEPEINWPYLNPSSGTDNWNMNELIHPFIVTERELQKINPGGGVLAVVSQNPYALFYSTDFGSKNGRNLSTESNEYKTRIGVLGGLPIIRSKTVDFSRTRFFLDTTNPSREAWYNNVFQTLNLSADPNYNASNSTSGLGSSFKNKIEVVTKSAVNDKSNVDENVRFQIPYTFIDPEDISFVISNNEGTVIPGGISISQETFGLNVLQKSNFFYQKEAGRDVRIYEDVHTLKCTISDNTDNFSLGTKIRQDSTGATASIIREDVDESNDYIRTLYLQSIFGDFDEIGSFSETNSDVTATPLGKVTPISREPHTFLNFIFVDSNGNETNVDDVFNISFDRKISVDIRDSVFDEEWTVKEVSTDTFKGGYLNYEIGKAVSTSKILKNSNNWIVLRGEIGRRIRNAERYSLTLFDPNEIALDFLSPGYKSKRDILKKRAITTEGNILYQPIKITLTDGVSTEIESNVRDNRTRFSGISKLVQIANESVFDFTGVSENPVQVYGFIEVEKDEQGVYDGSGNEETADPISADISLGKIPLSVGGPNLDIINIPKSMKDKILVLDIRPSLPSDTVRAIVNKKDGTTETFEPVRVISDQRFIVKVNQQGLDFYNITIEFDQKSGTSTDSSGVADTGNEEGISIENEVLTKTGFKAIGFNSFQDVFNMDGFEAVSFTDKDDGNGNPSHKYKLAVKAFIDGFEDSALIHGTSDHFWTSGSTLFHPAFEIDNSKIERNEWIKSGSQVITKNLKYNNGGTVDFRLNLRHYFRNSQKKYFTRMTYVNRGNAITDLVMIHRLDLNHLVQFLPSTLLLPEEDFSPEEKTAYENDFRDFASANFTFTDAITGRDVGIASEELLENTGFVQGDSVVYSIGYNTSGELPISNVTGGLTDSNLGIDIKVTNKEIGPTFKIPKTDGTGEIRGEIYYLGNRFLSSEQDDFQLINNDFMYPFLGHSGAGDSIMYGVGIQQLRENHGFEFGIMLEYVDLV